MLIANRGEIAVRVIRACHEMGIRTVAVYSDADREALHVRYAHEARRIGPPPAADSYLRIDRILDAAKEAGAEAIHPGYGFLAENPAFSRACRDAGIVFIGPPPEAMEALGDKVRARAIMAAAGVPVVPGSPALPADPREAARAASGIGYPVLLKAAAGGGGKGMRIVRREAELGSLLAQARGEARSAFGDDTVFLERYVERPRHIEVQILADAGGRCIHLGERECSIQRRHQKLIEECPSPAVDEATRRRIGDLAVRAARASGYVNAGTVEFLRGADGSFYFMEVNARLQVEHPITELVYGVDLVKAQIDIAAGGALPLQQEEVASRGHAIECRIIAEDPARNFMPAPGTIRGLRTPSGPGIRYDGGTFAGWTVPVYYDPLLSKLCAWGRDRIEAIDRMARALDEYRIDGLETSINLHRKIMAHPAFRAGDLHTGFLEEHPELLRVADDPWLDEIFVVAVAVEHFRWVEAESARGHGAGEGRRASAWRWSGARGWKR
ncbi:MAG: acetyl-CoA carboxylase biotin carboxylase subunit [Acidobacteriia bacterium]|nr:acetyl-CoA carboxylase biotin carboxylase subunit [Terriglobia bacterium]